MKEAEYLMRNYGDRGGCFDLHNSSYYTKAEFNNCFVIHSIPSLKTVLKHTYLHRC